MRRYPKKTKIEEKMDLSYRYQLVLRYAESTGPLYEAPDDKKVQVLMPWSLKKGLTVLHDGEAVSACSLEHAQMVVANPAKQLPATSYVEDAASEMVLRLRFDRWPVVRAMREMERGAIHFDWINPRDIDRLLEEAFERWQRFWQSLQPRKIIIRTARLEFTPSGIVTHEIPA